MGERWAGGHNGFRALFLAGLLARLFALPLWGTFDTEVQKAWSARAVREGVADIYGPSDGEILDRARSRGGATLVQLLTMPFPRTTFDWGTSPYFVDYPPGSVLVLWAAGKLYQAVAPDLPNRRLFNAAVNLPPLLGSLAIAILLERSAPGPLGRRRALLFWLNPAVFLAAPVLGYQDTVFGALAVGAVLALMGGRHVTASALVVASGLVKPQGALLLPALLAITIRETGPRAWARAALAGAVTAAAILLPWWGRGHLLSALDGCRRPLAQGTLAPLGMNVWWIAGYFMRWSLTGPFPLAEVERIDAFEAWAGWDPRLISRLLLAGATAAVVFLLLRAPREDRRIIPLAVILQVHAYALLGTSVHENHTFLAVLLAPLLVGVWPKAGVLLGATSAFLFASLYLAAGLGRRITSQRFLESLRLLSGLDLTVILAAGHVVLAALLFLWAARTKSAKIAGP